MSKGMLLSKSDARHALLQEHGRSLNLVSGDQAQPRVGLPTGWSKLDQFLLWQGLPKSTPSLLVGDIGACSNLWMRAAAKVTQAGQWTAFISDSQIPLTPWGLRHRNVNLARLLCVSGIKDIPQLLWSLQEIMSSCLVELVGCDLGPWSLRDHHLIKVKKLCLRYQTSVVFVSQQPRPWRSSHYSLILNFERDRVVVDRALHRPTPHTFERRDLYADTLPLLASGRRALCG